MARNLIDCEKNNGENNIEPHLQHEMFRSSFQNVRRSRHPLYPRGFSSDTVTESSTFLGACLILSITTGGRVAQEGSTVMVHWPIPHPKWNRGG